jgi:hypothetical protein
LTKVIRFVDATGGYLENDDDELPPLTKRHLDDDDDDDDVYDGTTSSGPFGVSSEPPSSVPLLRIHGGGDNKRKAEDFPGDGGPTTHPTHRRANSDASAASAASVGSIGTTFGSAIDVDSTKVLEDWIADHLKVYPSHRPRDIIHHMAKTPMKFEWLLEFTKKSIDQLRELTGRFKGYNDCNRINQQEAQNHLNKLEYEKAQSDTKLINIRDVYN